MSRRSASLRDAVCVCVCVCCCSRCCCCCCGWRGEGEAGEPLYGVNDDTARRGWGACVTGTGCCWCCLGDCRRSLVGVFILRIQVKREEGRARDGAVPLLLLSNPPEWFEWRGEGREAQTHSGHAAPREKRRGENGREKVTSAQSPFSRTPPRAKERE
ncbi:hypothetical protein DFH08DRAFT_854678 [Mycena albidolilacea]|uniref:Secreted protein n=1 Tax=Mycena albidolilacea TaxID=1033008 RepID=A0AAD7ABR7_9AGAR|nr:hypothetical protein DFH08DRAFT_854678 [Mycena albidolilacea]